MIEVHPTKAKKKQDDRLLKRLSQKERAYQVRLRTLIRKDIELRSYPDLVVMR